MPNMIRGREAGKSGGRPLISLKRMVTSEKTNKSQAKEAPRKANLIMAFLLIITAILIKL